MVTVPSAAARNSTETVSCCSATGLATPLESSTCTTVLARRGPWHEQACSAAHVRARCLQPMDKSGQARVVACWQLQHGQLHACTLLRAGVCALHDQHGTTVA